MAEAKRIFKNQLYEQFARVGKALAHQHRIELIDLLAQAERDGQRIRGEGDATAAARYAAVMGNDADFYDFYRSLEAYRNSIGTSRDLLVLDPDSAFFRHFDNARAGAR